MNINTELRVDMLRYFLRIHTVESFKEQYTAYSDLDIKEMRMALQRSGDIRKVWGYTRATLYQTTASGEAKLQHEK